MALYTMADLHLSLSTDKPMDVFGHRWENYQEKIKQNWCLEDEDTIVLGGDISWAMNFDELAADFSYIESLKGKKIILKGNHDYWWNSIKKLNEFVKNYPSISFLHNNSVTFGGYSICGTRGWIQNPGEEADIKVLKREAGRLQCSIDSAEKEPIIFLHYPPLFSNIYCEQIMEVLIRNQIKDCYYGHLHGQALKAATTGMHYGIDFHLVSGDFLDFKPIKILDGEI